ncbi:Gustatory receptor 21a [Carabus blaptoides fortunei]
MMEHRLSIFDIEDHHVSNPHQRYVKNTERKRSKAIVDVWSEDVIKTDKPSPEELFRTDNFYRDTKSLLVLFQIMGVMPIERAGIGHTEWNWISRTTIYSYILFISETVYVTIVFKARLELTLQKGKRFDEYIYNFIFLSILVPHFLLPIAAWRNGPEVAKYKNMWTTIQNKYCRMTGNMLIFPRLECITWSSCVMSWLVSFAVMLAQFYLQPDLLFWHTLAYYHILAMLDCLCSLWFINCRAQGAAASGLIRFLKKALESPDAANQLAEARSLWVDLSHLMQQLGRAYSGMYAMFCILILLTTIVASYGCLAEILDHGLSEKEIGLFLITVYCMSILYIICNEAYHASRKMGPLVQERLLNTNFGKLDEDIQKEINMFLTAIDKNPPTMNLNGYTNVNRELITSVMASMGTYLVMLMQFKMSLSRNQQRVAAAQNATLGNTTLFNSTSL